MGKLQLPAQESRHGAGSTGERLQIDLQPVLLEEVVHLRNPGGEVVAGDVAEPDGQLV